jgi:hypothetical protein
VIDQANRKPFNQSAQPKPTMERDQKENHRKTIISFNDN